LIKAVEDSNVERVILMEINKCKESIEWRESCIDGNGYVVSKDGDRVSIVLRSAN